MPLGRFVEGGGNDLAFDRARHVGHFLGTLVDEEDDEYRVRMVGGDGVGDALKENRFPRPGR